MLRSLPRLGASLALLLVTAPALAQSDNPPPQQQFQFEFPYEPPLPPELAPDLYLVEDFTSPNLWPVPWARFQFRRPSGYIPPPCRRLVDDPEGRILDCWLEHHPTIANHLLWEFPDLGIRGWRDWPDSRKADLRKAFVHARQWKASGFTGDWPGTPFVDPAANQEIPYLEEDELRTVIASDQAWQRYAASVAISLATEIDAWVPWSLRDYDSDMLRALFSGPFGRYTLDTDDGGSKDAVFPGHVVDHLTPAHGATIYRFLLEEELIAGTPKETIGRVLEWSAHNMRHAFPIHYADGTEIPKQTEAEAFWGYTGRAPISEIIRGKPVAHPELGVLVTEPFGWTLGCATTTQFFRDVLALVNIPVEELISGERTGYHSLAHFSGESRFLTHSDDPYNPMFHTGDYRGRELLVSTSQWNDWFPVRGYEAASRNVGRQRIELNLDRPSDHLVAAHCQDLLADNAHADSTVLDKMGDGDIYSVATLEAMGLWDMLDGLAATSTEPPCERWRDSL